MQNALSGYFPGNLNNYLKIIDFSSIFPYIFLMLDPVDLKILALLEKDARLSNQAIGEAVGLTSSSVFERVKKLEKKGVIRGYAAVIDPAAVGRPITAFIRLMVGAQRGARSVADMCRGEPEVMECHHVAGEDCYILKVRTDSPQGLEKLLERLRSDSEVQRSVTAIVFSTAKESAAVVPAQEGTQ
jgi:Lrp/AsnC family leucine-responsive transcriptional regulator